MTATVEQITTQSADAIRAREAQLLRAFRISGAIGVASLVALAIFPFKGMFAIVAWTASGLSLTGCLRIAWLMRDPERGRSVFDALWLRSSYSGNVDPAYSARAPDTLTTFAHFAISLLMKALNSSGVFLPNSLPSPPSLSFTSGSGSTRTISALSLRTIA